MQLTLTIRAQISSRSVTTTPGVFSLSTLLNVMSLIPPTPGRRFPNVLRVALIPSR